MSSKIDEQSDEAEKAVRDSSARCDMWSRTAKHISLNQLWDHWSDRDLYVPSLSEYRGIHRHILSLNLKFYWQDTNPLDL
jgi:hypothetical protein